jgi:folate-binding protein YgfZ
VLDGYLVMEDAEIESSDVKWVVADEAAAQSLRQVGLTPASLPWSDMPIHAACGSKDQMVELAKTVTDLNLEPSEWHDWTLRHGVPRFGTDYDERDNLHAASLERRTVDWQKGCYLGQEVVCMQDMRGKVKKRLVLLRADGAVIAGSAQVTTPSGEEVGRVTSSAGPVAIASISAPHFENETALLVDGVTVCVEPLRA